MFDVLAAGNVGDEVGKVVGCIIGLLIVGFFFVGNFIGRDDKCSRPCRWALGLCLGALGVLMVVGAGWIQEPLRVMMGIVAVLAMIVAIPLAIVGLVQMGQVPGRTGMGRAIASLILSGIVLAIFVISFAIAARNSIAGAFPNQTQEPLPPGLPVVQTTSDVQTFEDLNFRYRLPGKPYVPFDGKKFNENVCFALACRNPEIYFVIIAEKNDSMKLDAVLEIVKANLKSVSQKADLSGEMPRRVGGIDGVTFRTDCVVKSLPLSYVHWVGAHRGYLYQLIAYTSQANRNSLGKEVNSLFARFEQIDPNRRFAEETEEAKANFGLFRSSFGYTLDLTGTDWLKWEDPEDSLREIGGESGANCFIVAPLHFQGLATPPAEAVNKALLKSLSIDPSDPVLVGGKMVAEDGVETRTFGFSRATKSSKFRFRIKVYYTPAAACLVAVWGQQGNPQVDATIESVLSRFKFPAESNVPILSSRMTKGQALLLNQVGLFCFQAKQYGRALGYFQQAAKFDPNDQDFNGNVMNALSQLERHQDVITFFDQLQPKMKANDALRSWKAFGLKKLGRDAEAVTEYKAIFSAGYRDDADFTDYVRLLASRKQWSQVNQAFDDYLRQDDNAKLRILQAEFMGDANQHAQAVALLGRLKEGRDYDPKIAFALIHHYQAMEEPKGALAICEEMIAKGLASADGYYLKGESEYALKWYRQAKESYAKALELSPKDETIARALKDVSAMLGEGDNTSIRAEIEPVPLPAELAKELPPVTAKAPGGVNAFYLHRLTACAYRPGQAWRQTTYMRAKVLDAAGVAAFSTLQSTFDPSTEQLFVNELLVRDGDGNIVSRGQIADYYVIDAHSNDVASNDRTLFLPVPQLQPGFTVELTLSRRTRGEAKEFLFQSAWLCTWRPCLLAGMAYLGDANNIRHVSRDATAQKIDGGLVWIKKSPPPIVEEPLQKDVSELVPAVYIADANGTWESLAIDYLASIKDKLALDDTTRQASKAATASAKTAEEKTDALARYVQRTCTYKAIEFGRRARIPNTPEQTLAHKYGDCKDHAVLLQQLLAAAGVPAHLVLIGPCGLQADLPSLDQFDHMIVYVPTEGGGRFIDPTDKEANPAWRFCRNLANRQALILDPARPRLQEMPACGEGSSETRIGRTVAIQPDGTLAVQEIITFSGRAGAAMRGRLKDMSDEDQEEWARSLTRQYVKSANVTSFKVSDVYDNIKPLVVEMRYDVTQGARKVNGELVADLPDAWEREYFAAQPLSSRKTPFRISGSVLTSEVKVIGPKGHVLTAPATKTDKGEGPFARWETKTDASPTSCTVKLSLMYIPGAFKAEQYAAYCSLLDQAFLAFGPQVRCRTGEAATRAAE